MEVSLRYCVFPMLILYQLIHFMKLGEELYIYYQLDALIIILFVKYYSPLHVSSIKYSSSGGHSCRQQHMVPSLSIRVLLACRYAASCVSTGHQELL